MVFCSNAFLSTRRASGVTPGASVLSLLLCLLFVSANAEDTSITTTTKVILPKGIPGIEFLGIGYDIVQGNPRGTANSELDPGYRQRVRELVYGGARSYDRKRQLPDGVEARAASTCKFDSKAVEISSEKEMREELSKETEINAEGEVSGKKGLVSASVAGAYSRSEKFESFRESNVKSQSSTFEAKAVCSEYDLRLERDSNVTFDASFKNALLSLPKEFKPCGVDANKDTFFDFIDTYGTHIVDQVILGAKYIVSTEIESRDIMELQRSKISVADEFSISIAASLAEEEDPDKKETYNATYKVVVDLGLPKIPEAMEDEEEEDMVPKDAMKTPKDKRSPVSGSVSFNFGRKSSKMTSKEKKEMISEKTTRVSELTIGGRPPKNRDWVEWAASVPDRPMPIKVRLKGIFEFMEDDQAKSFMQAVFYKYGLVFSETESLNEVMKASHYGVFSATGIPISSYSSSANTNYRTLVSTSFPVRYGRGDTETERPREVVRDDAAAYESDGQVDKISWYSASYCPADTFVCGMKAIWEDCGGVNDVSGITRVTLLCCNRNGDKAGEDVTYKELQPYFASCSSGSNNRPGEKRCAENSWVVGLQGQSFSSVDGAQGDPEGLTGLRMRCGNAPETTVTIIDESTESGARWQDLVEVPPMHLLAGMQAQAEQPKNSDKEADEVGVTNLRMQFQKVPFSTSVDEAFYSYEAFWEGSESVVSAYFVTPIHGTINRSPRDEKAFKNLNLPQYVQSGVRNHFGFMSTTEPSVARFGVRIYDGTTYDDQNLESFSFLSADNLDKNPDITSGVIHPDGFPLNKVYGLDVGYKVREDEALASSNGVDVLKIHFPSSTPKTSDFTLVLFPILFSKGGKLPDSVLEGKVALGPRCSSYDCTVGDWNTNGETATIFGPSLGGSWGYSFLKISAGLSVPGLYHGHVEYSQLEGIPHCDTDSRYHKSLMGGIRYCNDDPSGTDYDGYYVMKVRLSFSIPYSDIPSVTVTPTTYSTWFREGDSVFNEGVYGVHDISQDSTSVFFATQMYNGFTFVIMGPPELKTTVDTIGTESCDAFES